MFEQMGTVGATVRGSHRSIQPACAHTHSRLNRAAVASVCILVVTACDAGRKSPMEPDQRLVRIDSSTTAQTSATGHFPTLERVDLSLTAKGSFRPGTPIALITNLVGKRDSRGSVLRVRIDSVDNSRRVTTAARDGAVSVSVASRAQHQHLVQFSEPGYYHVVATVSSADSADIKADRLLGTPASEVVERNLWLLVSPQGGRVDQEYDASVLQDTSRYLTNGTTGAFRSKADAIRAWKGDAEKRAVTRNSSSMLNSMSVTFNGRVTYNASDPSGAVSGLGVPGARITGYCSTVGGTYLSYFDFAADANGAFSVVCSDDAFSINVTAYLSNASAQVNGYNNSWSGTTGWITVMDFGQQVDLAVANNNAARVFINHQRYSQTASTLFGRSRGQIVYRVSNSTAQATNYNPSSDYIQIGPNTTWGRNGIFVAVHEFGHAFHYTAIDPWVGSSYSCSSNGEHDVWTAYTTSCAYVEGFADFFAARVINSVDGTGSNGDFTSQNYLEGNPGRTVGNGLLIEGTFAALLIDLVDSSSDADGISGDDDALTISHYDLTQIMRQCRMSSPNTALLTNTDQFVYCTAGSVSERSYAPSTYLSTWAVYSGLSYDATTTLPSQSTFRSLWLYNFYNQ